VQLRHFILPFLRNVPCQQDPTAIVFRLGDQELVVDRQDFDRQANKWIISLAIPLSRNVAP
jgi:hypothetical protein